MVALNRTVPEMRACFAIGGYTGITLFTRLVACTCPPTRTRCTPSGEGAGGGGGRHALDSTDHATDGPATHYSADHSGANRGRNLRPEAIAAA
jgi:hypothetical protein